MLPLARLSSNDETLPFRCMNVSGETPGRAICGCGSLPATKSDCQLAWLLQNINGQFQEPIWPRSEKFAGHFDLSESTHHSGQYCPRSHHAGPVRFGVRTNYFNYLLFALYE